MKQWEEAQARQRALVEGQPRETGASLREKRMKEIRRKLRGKPEKILDFGDMELVQLGGQKLG